jgi:predicted MFS family arabinose efflux permease
MAPFMAMIQTVFQAANKRFTTEKSRSAGFSLWYLFMNVGAAAGGFLIDIVRKMLDLPNTHVFTAGVIVGLMCCIANFLFIRRETQLMESDQSANSKSEQKEFTEKKVEKKNPLRIAIEHTP